MSGILVECVCCDGKGKVVCRCNNRRLSVVETISRSVRWDDPGVYLGRCTQCNQLWKVYSRRWTSGGLEDVWLKPGMSQDGHVFMIDEAIPHLIPTDLLHWPYVELLKRVPFERLVELRRAAEHELGLATGRQAR
jgi:hypothetical protein